MRRLRVPFDFEPAIVRALDARDKRFHFLALRVPVQIVSLFGTHRSPL
jgi:hypothetical protein